MTTWDETAQRILTAAEAADVTVARSFIAPGPFFARDCRLIAVFLSRPMVVPLQREYAGACGLVPQHTWTVVFSADCVPTQDDAGNPPAPSAVSAWSKAFLRDAGLIYDSVLGAAQDGTISGFCESVSIGPGEMRGPGGQMASIMWPVTVQDLDG